MKKGVSAIVNDRERERERERERAQINERKKGGERVEKEAQCVSVWERLREKGRKSA